jgi:hypothetical protein
VLIHDVQLVEAPERVIPSFVWLESVENLERVFADALCISRSAGFEVGLRPPNWKFGPEFVRLSAVDDYELPIK